MPRLPREDRVSWRCCLAACICVTT
jgi:hypothetical protein